MVQITLGRGSAPHGVIVGWITDGGQNAIVKVDARSHDVTVFPLPASAPSANLNTAAFDGNGVLWWTGQSGYYGRLDPVTGTVEAWRAPRGRGPKYPFYGSRQMARQLRREGIHVGRHRVRRLMRLMGLQAIYQPPRTSVPHPAHRIYPYLLKRLTIDRPNQVWCADITYIPVSRGFLYLVAIMDWATRHVLSWRLSNTMDAGFCVEALNEALARYGRPEIFNTDQGSQFTSLGFTGVLKDAGIAISMDGRGRCMDNIFIERLWRSLKYEAVHLHELTDGFKAERVIGGWLDFYNTERPHSALASQTPAEAYGAERPVGRRGYFAPEPVERLLALGSVPARPRKVAHCAPFPKSQRSPSSARFPVRRVREGQRQMSLLLLQHLFSARSRGSGQFESRWHLRAFKFRSFQDRIDENGVL